MHKSQPCTQLRYSTVRPCAVYGLPTRQSILRSEIRSRRPNGGRTDLMPSRNLRSLQNAGGSKTGAVDRVRDHSLECQVGSVKHASQRSSDEGPGLLRNWERKTVANMMSGRSMTAIQSKPPASRQPVHGTDVMPFHDVLRRSSVRRQ